MISESSPVGVFDSGVGGLSVLRALVAHLPDEDYVYLADSIHCPYGSRTQEEVRRLSRGIAEFLLAQGAKVIVVACNTASAAALSDLRATYDVPFVGMVPAVKPAAHLTATGVVGVLATPLTFGGELYHTVVDRETEGKRVCSHVCDGLVECVERGETDSPEIVERLSPCLAALTRAGADTLVLGCTHYSFLAPTIRRLAGDRFNIVDPSDAIARQTGRVMAHRGLSRMSGGGGRLLFYTSGETQGFSRLLLSLMGWRSPARAVRWCGDHIVPA